MTDLEFMKDPNLWPRWPVLPLVKRNARPGDPDHSGWIAEYDGGVQPVVFYGNIWNGSGGVLESRSHKAYANLEAVANEWRVD